MRWYSYILLGVIMLMVVGISVLIGAMIWFFGISDSFSLEEYVVEFRVEDFKSGDVLEVRVGSSSKERHLYKNDNFVEVVSKVKSKPRGILEITDVEEVYDLVSNLAPVSDFTWEATLYDSARYVSFLKSKGYKIIRKVSSPTYIELIMESSKARKRLIIFDNSIMVGDLASDAKLPSLEDYIKMYKEVSFSD